MAKRPLCDARIVRKVIHRSPALRACSSITLPPLGSGRPTRRPASLTLRPLAATCGETASLTPTRTLSLSVLSAAATVSLAWLR